MIQVSEVIAGGDHCIYGTWDDTFGNQSDLEIYGTACMQADGSWFVL